MFPIARAFAKPEKAKDAVDELLNEGFPAKSVILLEPPSPESGQNAPRTLRDAMEAGLSLFRMKPKEVELLNESAQSGNTLVAVEAVFGQSNTAAQILDQHDPIQFPDLDEEREPMWDSAAPLSSLLMWPVLLRGRSSTTLARGRSRTDLTSGRSNTKLSNKLTFGDGQLTKPGYSMFGDGLKRNSPAPLSSMIGWRPVSEHKEWKTSFGFPLLTGK